ncbi:unnamed protein product, partial [Tetraodon nigroviridis]
FYKHLDRGYNSCARTDFYFTPLASSKLAKKREEAQEKAKREADRRPGKKRRGSEKGRRSENESASGQKEADRTALPAPPTSPEWVSLSWPAPPTCERPSMGRRPPSRPCLPTSGPTPRPCALSASTRGPTSCPPPTATTRSSCRSTPQTRSWPITCPACTTPTPPCGSVS